MSQTEIKQAILSHLGSLPGNTWRIALPNADFEPESNESYLELHFMPASTNQAALGTDGVNVNVGLAQITVAGEDNQGFLATSTKADEIIDHFKRGTVLTKNTTKVTITKAEINPAIVENDKYNLPVSIYYRAYTPN
jgi:hypothetical protein